MSTYYLHDGRNEMGPFTIDVLKKQKLTRSTPVRQKDSNIWMPAEKLPALKELVAPRKIKRPKDIVPVLRERITDLHYRKPKALYGGLLAIALIAGISIYSIRKATALKEEQEQPVIAETKKSFPTTQHMAVGVAAKPEIKKPVEKEDATRAARQKWNKLINATNSNYGIGFLGGIKDLKVSITNRSNYHIDEAIAKVTYIKANGGIWKIKLVAVQGIPAHDSKEQSVPDVGRGKKVKVSLYKVVSKKMKFSYTEGQKIKNAVDPYLKE
jgi:hypothetical protein